LSDKAYIQQLETENALLKATLAQVMEHVKELEVKVEELSKKVEQQSVKKNSNNSQNLTC
jgi:predicted nuclease with TOPRIM domain